MAIKHRIKIEYNLDQLGSLEQQILNKLGIPIVEGDAEQSGTMTSNNLRYIYIHYTDATACGNMLNDLSTINGISTTQDTIEVADELFEKKKNH